QPRVDGDGNNWIVVWRRTEDAAGTSTSQDVYAVAIGRNAGAPPLQQAYLASAITPIDNQFGTDQRSPTVAWLGGSALIGWWDEPPPGSGVYVSLASVDPFLCTTCEFSEIRPFSGLLSQGLPAIASQFSGGGTTDVGGAMIGTYDFNYAVRGRMFEA